MPIIHMATDPNKIPAGATNVRVCESYARDYPDRDPLYLFDTHVGLCISEREANGRDDSDFYMLVWDHETGAPREMMFATTRGWSYPCMGSRPDATPDVLALYAAWVEKREAEARAQWAKMDAITPRRGRSVRIVRGRKAPAGTEGVVFWEKIERMPVEGDTGRIWPAKGRIGVDTPAGRVFVNADQVEVVAG